MLNIDKLSYWERKSIFENIDHLIIGSGIVGFSTAFHLKKLNPDSRILILEKGHLPEGASSKNAGFACFGSATELADDIQNFGEDLVWETVALRWKGLSYLRQLIGDENLKLEINGSWDLIKDDELEIYQAVLPQLPHFNQKIQEITGESNVYSEDDTVTDKFGLEEIKTSFFNRLEGQIDTSAMNKQFTKIASELDITVLYGITAESIEGNTVITNIGNISAQNIAICTNGFAGKFLPEEDVKPARAQVLVTNVIPELKIKGTFHYQKGYYYFRNIDGRVLFGGGRNLNFEGETTTEMTNTEQIMSQLDKLLSEVILPNNDYSIDYQWAGIMGVGMDKKPIVKRISEHVYCGVRLGGMGVAIGTLVGKDLADLINN